MDHRYERDGHAHHHCDGEARHPFCQHNEHGEGSEHHETRRRMPSRRQWCVDRGCPVCCCVPKAMIFWIILLQLCVICAVVVILMNLLFNNTYGSTLSRYQLQQGLITSTCTIERYEVEEFESCKCKEYEPHCDVYPVGRNYNCMKIYIKAHDKYTKAIVTNKALLFRSDWEYALTDPENKCFNLDICRIDMDRTWENYKRKVNHYIELFDQFRQDEEPFTCFVHQPESYRITPSALVELNTTFKDLFLWFVYPVLVAIICCLSMLFVCYWYWPSSKRAKKYPHPRMYKDGGTTTDMDDSDMSPSPSAMGMGPSSSNNSGGWPKAGPADHDTGGSWPMYWR